jgi:hypothetical protein
MKRLIRRSLIVFMSVILLFSLLPVAGVSAFGSNIISQGSKVITGNYRFNCDTGMVGSTGDIWWRLINTVDRSMEPQSPAQIKYLGYMSTAAFNALAATYLDDLVYSSAPINGNSSNLKAGTVIAVRTNLNNYTKIQVVTYGSNLSIRYVAYRKPLTTPTPSSPANYVILYHYPRTTTLTWKPVTGATSYVIEQRYYSGSTWTPYPNVTIYGINNTSYRFDFIGDQRGSWRVTAHNANNQSSPSAWMYFTYTTAITLATPVLVSPANGIYLYNYPRNMTLAWKPVPGSTSYKVEVQYYSSSTWHAWINTSVGGVVGSSYSFAFIGKQPGRWRVRANGVSPYRNSSVSGWRYFYYGN